jgi:hypothetical protein
MTSSSAWGCCAACPRECTPPPPPPPPPPRRLFWALRETAAAAAAALRIVAAELPAFLDRAEHVEVDDEAMLSLRQQLFTQNALRRERMLKLKALRKRFQAADSDCETAHAHQTD